QPLFKDIVNIVKPDLISIYLNILGILDKRHKIFKTWRGKMSQDFKKCPVTHLTTEAGAPVVDNQNSMTAGARGPLLAQDLWLNEKLANFVREVIPERRMHAKGSGAFGTFTVTNDITQYSRAKIFSEVGKKTEMFARFSTVAGERGAA